jgi:hypothetical protein
VDAGLATEAVGLRRYDIPKHRRSKQTNVTQSLGKHHPQRVRGRTRVGFAMDYAQLINSTGGAPSQYLLYQQVPRLIQDMVRCIKLYITYIMRRYGQRLAGGFEEPLTFPDEALPFPRRTLRFSDSSAYLGMPW